VAPFHTPQNKAPAFEGLNDLSRPKRREAAHAAVS
jgi:hypothetical protein